MELMTREDFQSLLDGPNSNYYLGRWEYFSKVIELIQNLELVKVCELGPGFMPIVKDADVMLSPNDDHFGKPDLVKGKTIIHDATVKPWPIRDKEYDLLIALQVLEHLDSKQTRAFREIMRVSKRAVLSLPLGWQGGEEKPTHRAHRDIDLELIHDWTLNVEPTTVIEIPRTGLEFSKGPRLICYWDFE